MKFDKCYWISSFLSGAAIVNAPPPPGCIKPSYATVHVHILIEQRNLLVSVAFISAGQRNVDCWKFKKKMFTCVMMTDRGTKFAIAWWICWTFFLVFFYAKSRQSALLLSPDKEIKTWHVCYRVITWNWWKV